MSADPAGAALINPNRKGFNLIESLNWYSYVSNNPILYVDPTGQNAVLLNQSSAGLEGTPLDFGHNAVIVGSDKNGWTYFTKDGAAGGNKAQRFDSLNDFNSSELSGKYDRSHEIETSSSADEKMLEYGVDNFEKPYSVAEIPVKGLSTLQWAQLM